MPTNVKYRLILWYSQVWMSTLLLRCIHPVPYTLHLIHICTFVTLRQFLKCVCGDENITTQSTSKASKVIATTSDWNEEGQNVPLRVNAQLPKRGTLDESGSLMRDDRETLLLVCAIQLYHWRVVR
jgi:hypothetical protein